jgi:hypothetical protein
LQICQFRQYYYDEKLDKFNCTKCRGSRQSSNPATRDVRAGVLFNYPDIYHQYNRDKNGKKFRSDVSVNSSKFLWWICSKGHSWQACVIERTIGDIKHCPKCDPNSWKRKAKKNVNVKKGLQDKINRGQKIIYKPWSEK